MGLWRCWNPRCTDGPKPGFDFEAAAVGDVGECPKCHVKSNDPRFGNLIVRRVVIHFDPPHEAIDGATLAVCACDGKPRFPRKTSNAWPAVTCPVCMQTPAFAAAKAAESAEVHPDFAVPIAGDAKTGRIDLVASPPLAPSPTPTATKTGGCG